MPEVRPSVMYESQPSRTEAKSVSAESFRAVWQYEISSVPHIVTACIETVELDDSKLQVYYTDASESEAKRTMSLLMIRESAELSACDWWQTHFWLTRYWRLGLGLKPPQPTERRHEALGLFAVATLLKKLIAAKPSPLIVFDDQNSAIDTSSSGLYVQLLQKAPSDMYL